MVSTRVLSPRLAVAWAAFFNFVAFLIFGTEVAAHDRQRASSSPRCLTIGVIFAGLIGAIAWDVITWYFGLPTSSSHALVGGMAGAAVAKAGWGALIAVGHPEDRRVHRPVADHRAAARRSRSWSSCCGCSTGTGGSSGSNRGFRRAQLVSAAAFSLGHGANDAQKTMGVILALLIAERHRPPRMPASRCGWCSSAHTAIGARAPLFGGWRIVHTMGSRITKLQPVGGMSAETRRGGDAVLHGARGDPGVDHAHDHRRDRRRRDDPAPVGGALGRRRPVVWAWVLTIPGAFVMSYLVYLPFKVLA